MWELGLLQAALNEIVEAHVIQEKCRELFTEAELQDARRRLEALGYFQQPTEAVLRRNLSGGNG